MGIKQNGPAQLHYGVKSNINGNRFTVVEPENGLVTSWWNCKPIKRRDRDKSTRCIPLILPAPHSGLGCLSIREVSQTLGLTSWPGTCQSDSIAEHFQGRLVRHFGPSKVFDISSR